MGAGLRGMQGGFLGLQLQFLSIKLNCVGGATEQVTPAGIVKG